MNSFISYLISGISLGSIYALIALGYTMVYGIAKMLNFAQIAEPRWTRTALFAANAAKKRTNREKLGVRQLIFILLHLCSFAEMTVKQ